MAQGDSGSETKFQHRCQGPLGLMAGALIVLWLLVPGSGSAQEEGKKGVVKTIGEILKSKIRVSVNLPIPVGRPSSSQLILVNGDNHLNVAPVIDGSNLDIVRTVEITQSEGKKTKKKKVKERTQVLLGPGERVTLLFENGRSNSRTVSVVLKCYADDGRFIAATWPRDFSIPPSGSSTVLSWTFRESDLRNR